MSERNLRIWLLAERSSRALQRMMQQCGTGQRQAWEVIRKSRPHSIELRAGDRVQLQVPRGR
jgi:hypothetical protein